MKKEKMNPVPPGDILMEEFLKPLGITQYRLSRDINVPPRRINEIVHNMRRITADTALRFAKYFGNSPQFWMNLQTWYDLEVEKRKTADRIDKEVRPLDKRAA